MFHYGEACGSAGPIPGEGAEPDAESRPGGADGGGHRPAQTPRRKAIEAVLAAISASLPQGEAVTLRGLGTFAVRTKRARQAATPRPSGRGHSAPAGRRV